MGLHIGKTLRMLLKQKSVSAQQLAEKLGVQERSVQRMLKKKYLHGKLMVDIGRALDHDIIRYLYERDERPANPALEKRVEELERENEGLKEKVKMLEKLVKLMEKG